MTHLQLDSLNCSPGIITKLRKLCEKALPDLPKEAIRIFATTRTFIRLRFANSVGKEQANSKRLKKKALNMQAGGTKVLRAGRKTKTLEASKKVMSVFTQYIIVLNKSINIFLVYK